MTDLYGVPVWGSYLLFAVMTLAVGLVLGLVSLGYNYKIKLTIINILLTYSMSFSMFCYIGIPLYIKFIEINKHKNIVQIYTVYIQFRADGSPC